MSDEAHTIPDHVASRVARLINEAEDMRQQAADDLKQIYADLREELRGMGWTGSVVSVEVAALKGAIVDMRMDEQAKSKREEKGERIDDYVSLLTRARAREATSYAEATGREPVDANLVETVVKGVQTEIGRKALIAALDAMIEAEDEPVQEMHELPETAIQSGLPNEVRSGEPDASDAGTLGQVTSAPAGSGSDKMPATISDEGIPAFLKRERKALRPDCQHPDNCAGYGTHTCHACKKAMAEVEAA